MRPSSTIRSAGPQGGAPVPSMMRAFSSSDIAVRSLAPMPLGCRVQCWQTGFGEHGGEFVACGACLLLVRHCPILLEGAGCDGRPPLPRRGSAPARSFGPNNPCGRICIITMSATAIPNSRNEATCTALDRGISGLAANREDSQDGHNRERPEDRPHVAGCTHPP